MATPIRKYHVKISKLILLDRCAAEITAEIFKRQPNHVMYVSIWSHDWTFHISDLFYFITFNKNTLILHLQKKVSRKTDQNAVVSSIPTGPIMIQKKTIHQQLTT